MQDHYVARVSYPVVDAQTANERSRGLPLAGGALADHRQRHADLQPLDRRPLVREESLPAAKSRPTTSCSTTRGAMAARAITPAAPAWWARTRWASSTVNCASTARGAQGQEWRH